MLNSNDILWLENEFGGPVKWIDGPLDGFPDSWRGWFHLEISPLPSPKERLLVAADICNNEFIWIDGGKLKHSPKCTSSSHRIKEVTGPGRVKMCLKDLPDYKYNVAFYTNPDNSDFLNGQPVAIVFDPLIDFIRYPLHPHLNPGWIRDDTQFRIPDSVCYTADYDYLRALTLRERLRYAFRQVSIWLFRHQIWAETGEWIGEHEPALGPVDYFFTLNPAGRCRCGSDKVYRVCCMPFDAGAVAKYMHQNQPFLYVKPEKLYSSNVGTWTQRVYHPQSAAIKQLKKNF